MVRLGCDVTGCLPFFWGLNQADTEHSTLSFKCKQIQQSDSLYSLIICVLLSVLLLSYMKETILNHRKCIDSHNIVWIWIKYTSNIREK